MLTEACGRCVTALRGELAGRALAVAEPEVGAEAGSGPTVRGITSLLSGPARGETQRNDRWRNLPDLRTEDGGVLEVGGGAVEWLAKSQR